MSISNAVIVDYGLGNLRSVAGAIAEVVGHSEVTSDPNVLTRAERIILPGVGAFPVAANLLEASGLGLAIVERARQGVPILGICLGMQLLFDRGSEFGWSQGLGLIRGEVLPFFGTQDTEGLRGTHIGWRPLRSHFRQQDTPLLNGVGENDSLYFVHSFSGQPVDEQTILATVDYGDKHLVAAVADGNVMGVQFHPEKSGSTGLRVLENFLRL